MDNERLKELLDDMITRVYGDGEGACRKKKVELSGVFKENE